MAPAKTLSSPIDTSHLATHYAAVNNIGGALSPPPPPPSGGPGFGPGPVSAPPSYPSFNPGADPGYAQAQGEEHLGLAQLDSALRQAREQAIIRFGDPQLASMAGFGLDPQAAAFARQNYISGNADLARLDKQHESNRQAIINRLAAHGILGSGDLGYLEGQEGQQYGHETYDARNKILDYLKSLADNDLQRRQQLRQAREQALQQSYLSYLTQQGVR